jgi:hypothetical protein
MQNKASLFLPEALQTTIGLVQHSVLGYGG